MSQRSFPRFLVMLTMLALAAAAHAEGSNRKSLETKLKRAHAELEQLKQQLSGAGKALVVKGGAAKSPAAAESPPLSLPNGCPDDETGWLGWRDHVVSFLLQLHDPGPDGDSKQGYLSTEDVMTRSGQIVSVLDACKSLLHREPPAAKFANLRRFVETQNNANFQLPNPQHQLGHGVSDEEYLQRSNTALRLPCLLRSQEFLSAMQSPATYYKARDLIDRQNDGQYRVPECAGEPGIGKSDQWQYWLFRSQFLVTPDQAGTLGRFLIYAPAPAASASSDEPQPAHDRWVQFGIWTPEDRAHFKDPINNVSIVAVAKNGAGAPYAYDAMIDWYRCPGSDCASLREVDAASFPHHRYEPESLAPPDPSAPKTIALHSRLTVTGEAETCQACHKVVPVGIHPERRAIGDRLSVYTFRNEKMVLEGAAAAATSIQQLNEIIRSQYHRAPSWSTGPDDRYTDPANYGYPLGPEPRKYGLPDRTIEYLQACSEGTHVTVPELNPLRSAMNCASCHSGRQQDYGMINYPLATETRRFPPLVSGKDTASNLALVRTLVEAGDMPARNASAPQPSAEPPLNKRQRKALFQCLSKEYFDPAKSSGLLIDWLTADADDDSSAPPRAPATLIAATTPWESPAGLHADRARAQLSVATVATTSSLVAKCFECHSEQPGVHGDGPSLSGVLGRRIGSTTFGGYSPVLRTLGRDKGMTWNQELLMEFLRDQDAFVTKYGSDPAHRQESAMDLRYPSPEERRQIVEYLANLK